MARWLSIVGLGEDGLDGLSPEARALVDGAEVLVGGARHLAMVPEDGRERLTWTTPLSDLVDDIAGRAGTPLCVLATGDPMCFGIGVTLARLVPREELTVIPAPSAFALACARLGWPLAEVETLTLHGRPLALLNAYVQPGARLLVLSDSAATPAAVAEALAARGYGQSRITVLEHMGGGKERTVEGTATAWNANGIADFNTVAVECVADLDAELLPRSPGLPDGAYLHDGQLTKREVRAATLSALMPVPRQHLWDVGAGCGSVAIEWMRGHPTCRASAVERDPSRVELIGQNAARLGVPKLAIVAGEAPAALQGLAPPDAVFIGGGAGTEGLFEACWQALTPGGRLVANAVTLEGEQALLSWRGATGGNLSRLEISRADAVGEFSGWKPLRPVTQLSAFKR
jgi:precorrin-6Y C5,15-methyltransferase (decarboxylating)